MASVHLTWIFLIAVAQVFDSDAQCPATLNAEDQPKTVTSENYPEYYGSGVDCDITITATVGVVHVMSVHMDLYNADKKCEDYLEFRDDGPTGTVLHKACGMKLVTVQSSGTVMNIKFKTDSVRAGKGFALKYWQAPSYDTSCTSNTNLLRVGATPVLLRLGTGPLQCEYTLMAGSNDMIYTEIFEWYEPEALACGTGTISVHDGATKMIDTCGPDRPYWSLGSQGQNLTIKFNTNVPVSQTLKSFYIKAVALTKTVTNCNTINTMPIGPMSSYVWYPIFSDNAGNRCTKTFLAPETTARITAIGSTDCSSLPFTVADAEGTCSGSPATIYSKSKDVTLTPKSTGNPVLLKVASFKPSCNKGNAMKVMALNNTEKTIEIEDIQRDSMCLWYIEASADETVRLTLTSTVEDNMDLVMIYDGMGDTAQRLDMNTLKGKFENKVFTSSGKDISFKVVTNDKMASGKITVKYHSVLKGSGCPEEINMLATREKKNFTTPNYPMEYPLNSKCMWRFVSYRPDYVVVVEVLESYLPEDCSDVAYVNDGETDDDKKLGEWCGDRKPIYRGTGQTLLVTFDANQMSMGGKKGFVFRYYADFKTHRELMPGTDVLTIAGVLTIIVIVGGLIFIIYRLCSRRNARRKAIESDLQPITQ